MIECLQLGYSPAVAYLGRAKGGQQGGGLLLKILWGKFGENEGNFREKEKTRVFEAVCAVTILKTIIIINRSADTFKHLLNCQK